jgi:hypothetical protein
VGCECVYVCVYVWGEGAFECPSNQHKHKLSSSPHLRWHVIIGANYELGGEVGLCVSHVSVLHVCYLLANGTEISLQWGHKGCGETIKGVVVAIKGVVRP